jgi:dTDP-glucose 4,6-dehydratase
MTKILVTGGAGFIGSNFIHYLVNNRPTYQITCIDKLTYAGNLNYINELISSKKVNFIKGDIADKYFVTKLFNQNSFDIVVNFAAESHVDRSISNPIDFLKSNYIGVFNLLEEVRTYPKIVFHQVSTDEVYGDLPLERQDMLFTEESRFNPSSPYSASKAAADLLVKAYHRTYGIHATVSHSTNNYGPFQYPEKLIPLAILRARDDLPISLYGDGLNVRDWIHVLDHCVAIDLIIHKGKSGEVYNIGGDCEKTNVSVIEAILAVMGKSNDLIEYIQDRAGHDLRYAVDNSKIKNQFGWQPKIPFSQGLEETINWYMTNDYWNLKQVNSIENNQFSDEK